MRGDPRLEARDRQRAGRLHDAPRVVEDVLDGGADLVVGHAHHFVDDLLGDGERVHADLAHGDAVGEDADVVERHAPARLQRAVHRVGLERLDADDLHVGPQGLDVAGDARDEPAAADGDEHGRQVALALAQDLLADRALAGNHQRVVEGMDRDGAALAAAVVAAHLGVRVAVAVQHHLGAQAAHRLDLDLRRGLRHHDHGADAELARREGDALRVVAGADGDHAARALGLGQVRDAVVGAAQLEAEDRLQVLALEQDRAAQPARQARRRVERRLPADVVDAAGQDQPQHAVDGGNGSGRIRRGHQWDAGLYPAFSAPGRATSSAEPALDRADRPTSPA